MCANMENGTDIDKIVSISSSNVNCFDDNINMTLHVNLTTPLLGNTGTNGVYVRVITFDKMNRHFPQFFKIELKM